MLHKHYVHTKHSFISLNRLISGEKKTEKEFDKAWRILFQALNKRTYYNMAAVLY